MVLDASFRGTIRCERVRAFPRNAPRFALPTVIVGTPMTYDTHLLCQHGIRTASIPSTLFNGIVIGLIRVQAANVLLYAVEPSPLSSSPIECLPSSWRSTTPLEPHSSVCSTFSYRSPATNSDTLGHRHHCNFMVDFPRPSSSRSA